MITETLFFNRQQNTGWHRAFLSEFLQAHEMRILSRIESTISEEIFEESYLVGLLEEATIIKPLRLNFDDIERENPRLEAFLASPNSTGFNFYPGHLPAPQRYVVRCKIKYEGTADLLLLSPRNGTSVLPVGRIDGNKILFDLPLPVDMSKKKQFEHDLNQRKEAFRKYSEFANEDLFISQRGLSQRIKVCYESKFTELHAVYGLINSPGLKLSEVRQPSQPNGSQPFTKNAFEPQPSQVIVNNITVIYNTIEKFFKIDQTNNTSGEM